MSTEDRQERDLLRIIDANRNRALEALRVVEEHARFVLGAAPLARRTKELRHRVHVALVHERLPDLALHRDVERDPLKPTAEGPDALSLRRSSEDIALANLSRAKEAVRALEEYTKPVALPVSGELEQIRYAVYALEHDLVGAARRREQLSPHAVYVLLEARAPLRGVASRRPPLPTLVRAVLAGGARLVQLREKNLADRERLAQAREVTAIVLGEGGLLLVNDRADLAALASASGVHVGRQDVPASEARRLLAPGAIVGSSVHDGQELEAALAEGVDYLGIGTIFPSPTKPELPARGVALLRELAPRASVPIYAIGGITHENAAGAIEAGAAGVAVSSAVLDAQDVAEAVRRLIGVASEALGRRA